MYIKWLINNERIRKCALYDDILMYTNRNFEFQIVHVNLPVIYFSLFEFCYVIYLRHFKFV